MIIGVCGKSGSGKSTISKIILENHPNSIHVDIDKIGHKSYIDECVKSNLINTFGNEILTDGIINRKRLSEIVFSNNENMKKLENITWNFMEKEIDKIIEENKNKIIILDWLLLPKTKYLKLCDIKILMDVPYEIRKQRVLKRDNISEEKFNLRENASINYNKDDFDFIFSTSDNEFIRKLVKFYD